MEIKILSSTEKVLLMSIEDEDISIPAIVRHELLRDHHVAFAGVMEQHPLLKKLTMRVQTKGIEPLNVLISSCSKAIEKTFDLLLEVKKVLIKEGES
ncbi:MAG: RpoL/Rpb11 RNA polymerase subunit family protein [Nitrososphaerales archaeon]